MFEGECGYQCFPDRPQLVRKPDVSFVRRDRLPEAPQGWIRIAPDLAAEVISPNDEYTALEARVADFLDVGTPLFWVIDPINRQARVHHRDGSALTLDQTQPLDGEDVLPGFKLTLGQLLG